jgi:hypothetical protein
MRLRWAELVALTLAVSVPGEAQQTREIGLQSLVTSSDPGLFVIGPYAALRAGGRTRVSASFAAGVSDGDFAWRAESLGHFLLSPDRKNGWGAYFAGGVAVVGGPVDRGYIVLTFGAESRPGGSSGWVAELGVGGGLRAALGYRWRWHTARMQK